MRQVNENAFMPNSDTIECLDIYEYIVCVYGTLDMRTTKIETWFTIRPKGLRKKR